MVWVGETDRVGGHPTYQALVEMLHAEGIAGASAVRGVMGYGASGLTHASHLLDLAADLPVAVIFVDSAEAVARALPKVEALVETGLVTVEDVEAITYSRG
jgi:PII-like signaling protein